MVEARAKKAIESNQTTARELQEETKRQVKPIIFAVCFFLCFVAPNAILVCCVYHLDVDRVFYKVHVVVLAITVAVAVAACLCCPKRPDRDQKFKDHLYPPSSNFLFHLNPS